MSQFQERQTSSEWNEICQWLQTLNYMAYTSSFKNAGYDLWDIVTDLDVDDLTSIGIKPGHARRIHKQLVNRKSEPSAPRHANTLSNANRAKSLKTMEQTTVKSKTNANLNCNNSNASKIKQEIVFAEQIKNQLFQTMTRVLNGLQQQLIEMNVKFGRPILSIQRVIAAEKSKEHGDDLIEDAMLLDTLSHLINELKMANDKLWTNVNQFRTLADSHINTATQHIQNRIQAFNQLNSTSNNNSNTMNNNSRRPLLNTIIVNLDPKNNIHINNNIHNPPNTSGNKNKKVNANALRSMSLPHYYGLPPLQRDTPTTANNKANNQTYTMSAVEMMKAAVSMNQQQSTSTSGYIRKLHPMRLCNAVKNSPNGNSKKPSNNCKSQLLQSSVMNSSIVPPPPSSSSESSGSPTCKSAPLREYTANEIQFIRKWIAEYPNTNTKSLFYKFRQRFNSWKDDKESFDKFCRKIWKLCEESIHKKGGHSQNNLNLNGNANHSLNEPKRKKQKLNHNGIAVLPLQK